MTASVQSFCLSLEWRHNGRNSVSNHQPHDCLLNHLFRRRSKKASKLAFVRGIHRWPVNSLHKWPVTGKMFPFDDVIMVYMPILTITATSNDRHGILNTGQMSVCLILCLDWEQRNIKSLHYCHFVRGINRWPVDSPHKGAVMRKMCPFDDVMFVNTAHPSRPLWYI